MLRERMVPARKTASRKQGRERKYIAYSSEVRERAEHLYVLEGMTYARVAQATGMTARQIANWSSEGDWQEKKREYRRAHSEIKRNLVVLRSRLIARALETMDPKTICAVARLESAARESGENWESPAGLPGNTERLPADNAREAVLAMQEALKRKKDFIFSQLEKLTPDTIKEIKISIELIDRLRTFYRVEGEKPKGLSNETVNEIRRKILGLKEIPPGPVERAAGENGWKEEKRGPEW